MPCVTIHKPRRAPRERLLLIGGFNPELYAALRGTDLLVEEFLQGAEALAEAAQREYGVVLCSLRMSDAWGLDVMEAILKADPLTPVIISTHEQNPKVVVEAMQRGAYDYLIEPHRDATEVLAALERAVSRRAALRKARDLNAALAGEHAAFFAGLVGKSPAFRELCELVRQAGPTPSPVLIEGESGAGKEGVARALHEASARRHGPFVALHCGAIPESLLESELFGHEKGAFTGADATRVGVFEAAHAGTLFLDEIGLTSPACQGKLLRVLESGVIRRVGASRELNVDVRVVSATNEPLADLVAQKRFRADLFYRLNVVTLRVPSLRERKDDVPLLSQFFAQRFAREAGKPFEAFSEQALEVLAAYDYPGNVRELRNLVERAVVFARGAVIRAVDLPEALRRRVPELNPAGDQAAPPSAPTRASRAAILVPGNAWSLDERLATVERVLLQEALHLCRDNRSRAAALLGLKRTTLLQKLERYALDGKAKPAKKKPKSGKTRRGAMQPSPSKRAKPARKPARRKR
ncbi:MAG: sigma-54 dependent transcriptional regulator [Planctomycetota bacterium]|nr:sigma-54 dependent transcriptional regulator [Planctomycetota bacterium]